jgi:hypothetical protein
MSSEMSLSNSSLTDRMIRAARLDVALYNEVEADLNATSQALTVVIISSVAAGIGGAIAGAMAGKTSLIIGGLVGGIVTALLGWLVWSFVMYFVGTRMFGGTATYGELLRTTGFATSPGVLRILSFIPVLGGIINLLVGIWMIVTGFIAVREALDISTGSTIATIIVGIIAELIVFVVVGLILGAIGLSAAALTGGLG